MASPFAGLFWKEKLPLDGGSNWVLARTGVCFGGFL